VNQDVVDALLIGTGVVLVAVLAVRASTRFGLPTLLLYLGLGMLLGESGFGIHFSDAGLSRTLGLLALVLILAEGGLAARWSNVRPAVPLGAVLATLGVGVSIAVVAAASVYLLGFSWLNGVLLGAIVSPTDAAAVFATLRRLPLKGRLGAILEAESGFNDAPSVILVLGLTAAGSHPVGSLALHLVYEMAVGAVIGLLVGFGGAELMRRIALPAAGLYPLTTVALTVLSFAAATEVDASGFLAVYLTGVVLGNSNLPHRQATLGFAEGLAWLAQIGLFVLLGLLVSPPQLTSALGPAVVIGLVLLLVARPLSVLCSASIFRLRWRAQALLSWAGLRGAVPIVLATIPITAGDRTGSRIFNIVFLLVVVFTVVQGTSLPWVARKLGTTADAAPRELTVEAAPLEELAADLLNLKVSEGSRLRGVYVRELRLPRGAVVSLIVRDGRSFVPDTATRIEVGDSLLVVASSQARQATEERLQAVSRAGRMAGWLEHP
jgi:cell volume regulation protein A